MSDHTDPQGITEDELLKSIERLEALAENDLLKSQIVTGGNSDPGKWAGSPSSRSPEWKQNMPNGTDYKPSGGNKSIAELEQELAFAKASADACAYCKGAGCAKCMAKSVEDEVPAGMEKALCPSCEGSGCGVCLNKGVVLVTNDPNAIAKSEGDVEKSFGDYAAQDADVQEGFNVSSFLRGFGEVVGKSLTAMEGRINQRIDHHFGSVSQGSAVMAKGLADLSRVALAPEHYRAPEPARAPKSVPTAPAAGVSTLQKSFGADHLGASAADALHPNMLNAVQKSLVMRKMAERVEKGELDAINVVRYETTGAIDEVLFKSVIDDLGGTIQKAGVVAA